jgi:predicted amidohydrolase YtcJ
MDLVWKVVPRLSKERIEKACMIACEKAVGAGLTGVHWLLASTEEMQILQKMYADQTLPLRIILGIPDRLLDDVVGLGLPSGFGNEMLKICDIKVTADGAISARTAAVAEPYFHRPDYYGELAITKEVLRGIVMEGYPQGYRFCVHANGERAINMFLDIIEETQSKYPRKDPRNRIIHCTVVNADIIARIKQLGILPTIFGPYPYYHGDKIYQAFGAERLERMFAARSFLDVDVKVAAHSDHPASPYPPLMGIHALVNRKTVKGHAIGASQKISVMEALKLYTINGAYHTF